MPEPSPAIWPALLLLFAGAGSAGLGAWVVSPHRKAPWRRRERPRGRNNRGRDRPRQHRRDDRSDPAGAGRTHAARHPPRPAPRVPHTPLEMPPHPVVDPARRPLR